MWQQQHQINMGAAAGTGPVGIHGRSRKGPLALHRASLYRLVPQHASSVHVHCLKVAMHSLQTRYIAHK